MDMAPSLRSRIRDLPSVVRVPNIKVGVAETDRLFANSTSRSTAALPLDSTQCANCGKSSPGTFARMLPIRIGRALKEQAIMDDLECALTVGTDRCCRELAGAWMDGFEGQISEDNLHAAGADIVSQ